LPPEAPPPSLPTPAILGPDVEDPELLALPDPPRRERTFTVLLLALTVVVSCAMSLGLRGDLAYALSPEAAMDVGDLREVKVDATLDNHFVHARGALGAVGAIRFERPFEADTYRISPVAGRRDLWVEVRVPAGEEGGRYVPPNTFGGRWVAFDEAGPRHRGLASAIESATGEAVPPGARVLVDGEAPARARWAVALAAMFLGFAAWNGLAIVRLLRRAR
jgi:hypothetical protein